MIRNAFVQLTARSDTSSETSPSKRSDRHWALAVAIIATLLFFYPSLYADGKQAGFVYAGDAWHGIIAQFYVAGFYASHGIFSAVDFFTHNGASEYFLRPNYAVYHPLVLILAPFFAKASAPVIALMYVVILAVHAFIGVYFLQRLGTRFLSFDAELAAFLAVGYVFSIQAVHSLWYLSYDIVAWMMPTAIYAGLAAGKRLTPTTALFASVPTFLIFTSGYVALAVVVVAVSALFIGVWSWNENTDASHATRLQAVIRALIPCAIASLVAAPLLLAIDLYHQTVEIVHNIGASALYPVAFAMSEQPKNLMRLFAENLVYPGPRYELALFWGLVPVVIFALYFIQFRRQPARTGEASRKHRAVMFASAVIYVFSVLIIFGPYSVLSSVFYYFVPIAGYMHIYQRYLLVTHLFLMLFISVMLGEIADDPPRRAAKIVTTVVATLLLIAANLVDRQPWADPAITNGFVVELFLALLFLIALVLGNRRAILVAATSCCFLVSLGAMYHYSDDHTRHQDEMKGEQITYDPAATNALADYFRQHSTKPIIKYIDLLPTPQPYVPKNFPWFVLNRVKLSSYFGYEWHLGANYQYRRLMEVIQPVDDPDLAFRPDWEWLRMTGAEFALYEEGKKTNDPKLAAYLDLSDPGSVYRFAGNNKHYVVAPLKFPTLAGEPVVFDNGYIRVHSADTQAKVRDFATNDAGNIEFTIDSAKPANVEYLFWPNEHLHVRVDDIETLFTTPNRLMNIAIPSGNHGVSIQYRHVALSLFKMMYALYGALLIGAAGLFGFKAIREHSSRLWP